MSHYDFQTLPDRLSQHTYKWEKTEEDPDLLPLWIADMDFLPVPEIKAALMEYVSNYVFGYAHPSDALYQAIVDWEKDQHGYETSKDSILFISGVVPAIGIAIQAFSQVGDAVLINTPVYPPFARTVKLNKRKLITNSLIEVNGHFEIDFEQLEKDLVENDVKVYIFCSPHNPGGRVWTREEIQRVGDLCKKYGVLLVSDEIHQDFALFGHVHHSINTVDDSFKEFSILLSSATKTFNIADSKNSFVVIENPALRSRFAQQQLANNQHEVPTIGLIATEAAFRQGLPWLQELKKTLEANAFYAVDHLREQTDIWVMNPEGTYLLWLDFSAYGLTNDEIQEKLVGEAKVLLNDGATFGIEGKGHARLNLAAPTSLIQEACQRIAKVFPKKLDKNEL